MYKTTKIHRNLNKAYPHCIRNLIFVRFKENRLCAVARVLSATLDDSTGKFETLGSNFSQETRQGATGVHSNPSKA